mgnify:CR=1 FL=1
MLHSLGCSESMDQSQQIEQQAVKGGDKNIGGGAAPKVTGTSAKEKQ